MQPQEPRLRIREDDEQVIVILIVNGYVAFDSERFDDYRDRVRMRHDERIAFRRTQT